MRDVRMAGEQPDQLRADVAGGADDRDPHRVAVERAQPGGRRRAGAGSGVERTVRRDRRARRVRAHRRAQPLTGGRLEGSEIGRNVVTA